MNSRGVRLSTIGLAATGATFLPSIAGAKSDQYTPAQETVCVCESDSSLPLRHSCRSMLNKNKLSYRGLGKGSGTGKAGVVADRITFNNMMNKGVFGNLISALQSATGTNENEVKKSRERDMPRSSPFWSCPKTRPTKMWVWRQD
jgi:hypothetical protein